jgi:hypothetical protein
MLHTFGSFSGRTKSRQSGRRTTLCSGRRRLKGGNIQNIQEQRCFALLTITRYHLVAHEADIAKELVVVVLAVCQTFLLIVPSAKERLLAFGTHEML